MSPEDAVAYGILFMLTTSAFCYLLGYIIEKLRVKMPLHSIDYSSYQEYECTLNGSSKWWGVALHQDGLGYTTFWGKRIRRIPTWKEKIALSTTRAAVRQLVSSKIDKGYTRLLGPPPRFWQFNWLYSNYPLDNPSPLVNPSQSTTTSLATLSPKVEPRSLTILERIFQREKGQ